MPQKFLDGRVSLYAGDSREVIKGLPDASIDSCVCDPPYALVSIGKRFGADNAAPAKSGKSGAYARASAGFMNKKWDTGETAFDPEFWAEVLRVLKPGGHIVAFGGTRSYHRLACAIEDAGFEIRDQLAWAYGTGFPKSHDVSKGINKAAGIEYEARPASGVGFMGADGPGGYNPTTNQLSQVGASTPEALQWQGWGTALKPAWEPIVLARRPLIGTVAANVLAHGTGAINVDGCRVGEGESRQSMTGGMAGKASPVLGKFSGPLSTPIDTTLGRWPANIVHDGSDEVLAAFPNSQASSGEFYRKATLGVDSNVNIASRKDALAGVGYGDSGSAARFFYSAKADTDGRIASKHPTVKPVDLMQWLCRLVTPPSGTVLDPFAGTGTTGEAAWREGFSAILIEREEEYRADIARRMALAGSGPVERSNTITKARGKTQDAGPLFADGAL